MELLIQCNQTKQEHEPKERTTIEVGVGPLKPFELEFLCA